MLNPWKRARHIQNSIRGAKAQATGRDFENWFDIRSFLTPAVAATRVPDGCKQFGGGRIIRVKTPWDWVLSYAGRTALLDTKTTSDKTFAWSHIELHQVKAMLQHTAVGTLAGYVIWYREQDQVAFHCANDLGVFATLRSAGKRGSISHDHPKATLLGCSATFDVRKLFDTDGSKELPGGEERHNQPGT